MTSGNPPRQLSYNILAKNPPNKKLYVCVFFISVVYIVREMSYTQTSELTRLQHNFQNIWVLKDEIQKLKQTISVKLNHLKTAYGEMTKKNTKKMYLFCLDTFFFQYKTYSIEMENLDKHRTLLNNRMYCDYYKLYNIITTYMKDNAEELDIEHLDMRTFTPYKDLEPYVEYNLDDIKSLHATILAFIKHLQTRCETNEHSIRNYNAKNKVGFSISNFLNTMEFENLLVKQQISLYLNYLAFFHISQQKHLKRLMVKLQEFDGDIEANLNVDTLCSIDDIDTTESSNDFFNVDDDHHTGTISQYNSSANLNVIEQVRIELVEEVQTDNIPKSNA